MILIYYQYAYGLRLEGNTLYPIYIFSLFSVLYPYLGGVKNLQKIQTYILINILILEARPPLQDNVSIFEYLEQTKPAYF